MLRVASCWLNVVCYMYVGFALHCNAFASACCSRCNVHTAIALQYSTHEDIKRVPQGAHSRPQGLNSRKERLLMRPQGHERAGQPALLSLTCDCTMYASLKGCHQQWLGSAAHGAAVPCSNLVVSMYVDCEKGLGQQALRAAVPRLQLLASCM